MSEESPTPLSSVGQLSPDGHYRWDGTQWMAYSAGEQSPTPPSSVGQLSPDGHYRWDGAQWTAYSANPRLPQTMHGHIVRNVGIGLLGLIAIAFLASAASAVMGGKHTSTNAASTPAAPEKAQPTLAAPAAPATAAAPPTVIRLTGAQKAAVQNAMNDSLNHYKALFAGGKQALGSEKYPDAPTGLVAMEDPNSAASRFSHWRTSSGAEQDVSYIGATKTIEAQYSATNRPNSVDTWRDDVPTIGDALNQWVQTAVSWQISVKSDADLAGAAKAVDDAFAKVQTDIDATLKAS